MGHPTGYPPGYPPPPKPPLSTADVVGSVVMLVLTVVLAGAGAVVGLFSLAFLDHCPPATCSVDGAVTAVMGTLGAIAVLGVTGLVLTVVRLSSRKPAWPFALATLGLCVAAFVLGGAGYTSAVS